MTQSRLLFLLFAFCCESLFSQNYFQKTYHLSPEDSGAAAEVLPGNDILTAGFQTITDPIFARTLWIQRLTPQGDIIWSKQISDSGLDAAADILREQNSDGFWVIYNSSVSPQGANRGGWIKLSASGDVLFGQKSTSLATFKRIVPLSDGGYLIAGYDEPTSFSNAFALKINANGSIAWKTSFGDAGDDAIGQCWEDAEGFLYCAGYSGDINLGQDGLLAKLSPSGAVLWTRRYGTGSADRFVGVAPFSSDTSLLLAGYSSGFGGGERQVWLTKVSSSGVLRWSRTYSISNQDIGAIDLLQIPGNQFLVAASDPSYQVGNPAILFKISADGDLLWEYQYKSGGEREILREVLPATGGFVAAGSSTADGDEDVYVLKIAADGLIPGTDCCPVQAGLTVKAVVPDTEVFTAGTFDVFGASGTPLTATEVVPGVMNTCTPIDLAFSVSDSSICPGECVDIVVTGNTPDVTYSFSTPGGVPDANNPLRICYPDEGVYFITRKGENNVCSKDLSIKIEVGNRPDAFPNAFTPNGDGVNDTFKPVFFCPVVRTNFKIYNRWGQKVFETRDPNEGWDGKIDGEEASSDVYAWQVEYEAVREGQQQKFTEKGDVALLR